MNKSIISRILLGCCIFVAGQNAGIAANAAFQNFFSDVCQSGGAQGSLSTRCNETVAGSGDLSGDSESSLNPTQTLSSNDPSLEITRKQAKENRERLEQFRGGEEREQETAITAGRFSLLINGRYTDFERDESNQDGLERGFDGDGWAFDLGFDYRISDRAVAGAFLSYSDTDSTFDQENDGVNFTAAPNAGNMQTDGYGLTLFGSLNIGDNAYMEASGGYGKTNYTFDRNAVFQESGRTIPQTNVNTRADTDGQQLWAGISGGYIFNTGAFSIGPYAGLIWAKSDIDGYTETDLSGSGLNMRVDDIDLDSLLGQLGISGGYAISTSWGVIVPQLRIEYDHEFKDDAPSAVTSYVFDADQTQYGLSGFDRDQNYYDLGASIVFVLPGGWSSVLDYSTLVDYDDLDRSTITLGLRKEF